MRARQYNSLNKKMREKKHIAQKDLQIKKQNV